MASCVYSVSRLGKRCPSNPSTSLRATSTCPGARGENHLLLKPVRRRKIIRIHPRNQFPLRRQPVVERSDNPRIRPADQPHAPVLASNSLSTASDGLRPISTRSARGLKALASTLSPPRRYRPALYTGITTDTSTTPTHSFRMFRVRDSILSRPHSASALACDSILTPYRQAECLASPGSLAFRICF